MGLFLIVIIRSGVDLKDDKRFKKLSNLTTPVTMIKQNKRRLSLQPPMAAAAPVKTGGYCPIKFYQEV